MNSWACLIEFSCFFSRTYVVQKVLGLGSRKYSSMICERLQGNYIPLSLIKHGSYTVEKCLKACGCRGLDCFSKEIAEDKSWLAKLARHEFGNYVVKVALEVSKMVSTELVCLPSLYVSPSYLPKILFLLSFLL